MILALAPTTAKKGWYMYILAWKKHQFWTWSLRQQGKIWLPTPWHGSWATTIKILHNIKLSHICLCSANHTTSGGSLCTVLDLLTEVLYYAQARHFIKTIFSAKNTGQPGTYAAFVGAH